MAGYYGFTLAVRPSVVRPSVFSFPDDNLKNINGFSRNLVCALILLRSGSGFLIGEFRQFLTVICSRHVHIFVSER